MDESGDMGWSLHRPYTSGGSSRFLVIACVGVPNEHDVHVSRTIRQLYDRFGWNARREKKWTEMGIKARLAFSQAAVALKRRKPAVQYRAIIVSKPGVAEHLRHDGNLLYSYMTKELLIEEMSRHGSVCLVPDPRSLKQQSGNSLPEYLKIQLLFEKNVDTRLHYHPLDSGNSLHVQFADMLAGVVSSHYEFGERIGFDMLAPHFCELTELTLCTTPTTDSPPPATCPVSPVCSAAAR